MIVVIVARARKPKDAQVQHWPCMERCPKIAEPPMSGNFIGKMNGNDHEPIGLNDSKCVPVSIK